MALALRCRHGVVCRGSQRARATQERPRAANCRILRYPGGEERTICYPTIDEDPDEDPEWAPWLSASSWAQGAPPALPDASHVAMVPTMKQSPPAELEVLTFSWSDVQAQAEATARKTKASYQVLRGCPWVLPRPVFVLTLSHGLSFDSQHHFYTLRTRVTDATTERDVTDELGRVLGNAPLARSFQLSQMLDGVITFPNRRLAEVFAADQVSEQIGGMDVHICELSSHELFRLAVGDAQGCVVAVGFGTGEGEEESHPSPSAAAGLLAGEDDGVWLPAPHQLASCLRGDSGWGEW